MEKFNDAVESVLEFLEGIPLSAVTVKNYQRSYCEIINFCKCNRIESFDDCEAEMFIVKQQSLHDKGEFGINRFRQLRKAAMLLADQNHGRELVWGRTNYSKKMNEEYEDAASMFSANLGQTLSANTCKGMVSMARQFLAFLEGGGICSLKAIKAEDVKLFMADISQRYGNSMKHVVQGLKSFCSFLNISGLAGFNASRYLVRPAPKHVKLLPCFTDDEDAAIFAAVDTSTPLGKRDFAIMKLAVRTGLRGVDILGLKRSDIDWRRNEINVLEIKTNTYVSIPLLPDVGNAIAEYIMDARPASDSPYVFLRNRMPHERLFATGCDIINRYLKKAGIAHEAWDGKSFHAFRRTVGTRLVKAKVPLQTAAQVLIHKDLDSTKRYISLDDETLRVCCLDISEYTSGKEGLS